MQGRKITFDTDQVKGYIEQGLSMKSVCELLECSSTALWRFCQRENLPSFNSRGIVADGRKSVLRAYKIGAVKRGYEFTLTEEEFYALIQRPCIYCGRSGVKSHVASECTHSPFIYTGLDREDNDQGYTIVNSVPCCEQCNRGKRNSSVEEFREWIAAIVNFNKGKL